MKINEAAYADANMHTECPHCGAEPNQFCTRPDGVVRRTPCIKRIRPSVGVAAFEGRDPAPLYVTKNETTP